MKINKNLFKRMISRIYIGFVPILFIVLFLCMKPAVKSIIVKSDKYKTPANSYFTDMNFYKCVISGYNNAMSFGVGDPVSYDTNLSDEQLGKITSLHCSGNSNDSSTRVKNVDGIEKLTSLAFFYVFESDISEMDLSHNTNLVSLDLYNSNLSSIDLSHNIKLSHLRIEGNRGNSLSEIDLSHNTELTYLNITLNKISDIDLQFNKNLESLYLKNNQLNNIDLSHNIALKNLDLSENKLEEINLENNTLLEELNISYNELSDIDLSHNIALKKLVLSHNKLKEINLNSSTLLTYLNLDDNFLSEVDLSHNTNLSSLYLQYNSLSSVDLSYNPQLLYLHLHGNNLNQINLDQNKKLIFLSLGESYYLWDDYHRVDLMPSGNQIANINLENNTSLETLHIMSNNLESIDLSHNTELVDLNLSGNYLTNINLEHNTKLNNLDLSYNKLEQIDISHNTNLLNLDLDFNLLTNLNLNNNMSLKSLNLRKNFITNIDLSHNTNLTSLNLGGNQLKYVDLSNTNLENMSVNSQRKYYNIYKHDLSNISEQELKDIIDLNDIKDKYTIQYPYLSEVGVTKNFDFNYYINDIEISSNVYVINDQDNYIYTGSDTNNQTIKNNIVLTEYDGLSSTISNNKYIINYDDDYIVRIVTGEFYSNSGKYGYEVVKEFDLVNYRSSKYDLSGDNVDVIDNNIQSFLDNITCRNCNAYVYDGTNNLATGDFNQNYTLRIIKGENVLKEFSLNLPVSGVNIAEENIKLSTGLRQNLNVEFTPSNAHNKEVIWESSNPSVATVENGVVTAVGVGNATITVKTVYGEFTDTCNVTVTEPVKHNVLYKKPDGTVFKTLQFLPGENVIQKFDEIFYFQGKKFIGWIYDDGTSSKTYTLDKSLSMPNNDIELVAQYADVMFGNIEYDVDINNNNKYLNGIDLNIDVNDLDNLDLDSNYKIKVFKKDRETLKTSGNVGTGDVIKVYVNNNQDYLVETYTVVIKGDLNGNGEVNVMDLVALRSYVKVILNNGIIDYCYKIAGDLNDNDEVNIMDLVALRSYIKELLKSGGS